MNISVITNGISNDYETCCKVMCETGVAYAEIQNVGDTPVENLTVDDAVRWKKISDNYGITPVCVTTHAFAGIPVHSIEVDDDQYRKNYDLLRNGIAMAKALGVNMVRSMSFTKAIVTFGGHGAEQWLSGGNRAWPKFIKLFLPLVKLAEDEGITLLVETCFNSMNTSAALNRKMIEEIGSDNLKMVWDMCNATYYHEYPTLDVYESIKHVIGHIHIKDAIVDSIMGSVDFCPLGSGVLAPYLHDIAHALRRDNYQGFISLENVYKPDDMDFVDGYRVDMPMMQKIFG